MALTEDFGSLLRLCRRLVGLRQGEFGRLIGPAGVTQSYVSRIEKGGSSPTLDAAEEFAQAIGFRPVIVLLPQTKLKNGNRAAQIETMIARLRLVEDQVTRAIAVLKDAKNV